MWSKQTFGLAVLVAVSVCPPARSAQPGYVDSSVCAGCHRQAAEGYSRTGMARSFGTVRPDTKVPNGKFQHPATLQDYSVINRNQKVYLRRSTPGFDGVAGDVLETVMGYWIGSGNHGRSYLSRLSNGKLVELPLTWYAGGGGHWAMSPGYDVPFHAGFSRRITNACLFCHSGYPDLPAGTDPSDANWKLPDPLVEGIDCQRCHGPGQRHLDAVKQGLPLAAVRAAIVNPKKLDSQLGMDVCLQCHLETSTIRLPGVLRNYDRGTFSYRPGEPLGDYARYFQQAPGTGQEQRLEFVGEAYRMRMSACFRESKGALTCLTCHNPHDIPRGEDATRRYASICQSCHQTLAAVHPASQDCVSCHMPKRTPVDAVQTTVADHFIQRRPPPQTAGVRVEMNDSTAPAYRGEVVPYYPAVPDQLYTAVAQVKDGANLAAGLPLLEAAIRQFQPARPEFYSDLADGLRQAGQPGKAVDYAKQAVQRAPDNWHAWSALGNAGIAAGDLDQAAEAFRRATTLAPDEAAVWQSLGEAYGRQGKFTESLAAFRSAVGADPEFAEGHNNLGTTLLRQGDLAGAEKELREAVRLRPESSVMQVNLASLLSRRGQMPEARHRFDLAFRLNPANADGRATYGAILAANQEWEDARTQLQEAIRLNPKSTVTHQNLGVVLTELKDNQGAIREFQAAVDLDPNYFEAQLKLGRLLVQNGKRAEARPHLLKAAESPDAQVKQAAARLLQN